MLYTVKSAHVVASIKPLLKLAIKYLKVHNYGDQQASKELHM
jgi:hypothetical protein